MSPPIKPFITTPSLQIRTPTAGIIRQREGTRARNHHASRAKTKSALDIAW